MITAANSAMSDEACDELSNNGTLWFQEDGQLGAQIVWGCRIA